MITYEYSLDNVRTALADGDPQWLLSHEDVALFVPAGAQ
jgi:hypothetical protein